MFLRSVSGMCLLTVAAFAQIIPAPEDVFQVRYVANLNVGDSVVNVQNAGTVGGFHPPSFGGGNICVNAYVVTPDTQVQACCTCQLAPDALASWSARSDLVSNLITPQVPTSVTIKLLASTQIPCNAANVTAADLAPGLVAWGSTIHTQPGPVASFGTVETEFAKKALSTAELYKLTSSCGFFQVAGSGFGICKSCSAGGR